MVKYEVWDAGSGNIVDWFDTFEDAKKCAKALNDQELFIVSNDDGEFTATYDGEGNNLNGSDTLP